MQSRKYLGLPTVASISFGLMAGCSGDSNTTTPNIDDLAAQTAEQVSTNNPCLYDGYTAMAGADGVTLCQDPNGEIAFWINADGSYGFPEATQAADPCNGLTTLIDDDGTTYCFDAANNLQYSISTDGTRTDYAESTTEETVNSSASETISSVDSTTGEVSSSSPTATSSASVTTCTDPVDGIVNINTLITSADGSTYMYNSSCIKTVLSTPASSSSVEATSSASTTCPATTSVAYTINGVDYYYSQQGYYYYFDESCNRVKVGGTAESSSSVETVSSSETVLESSATVTSSSATATSSASVSSSSVTVASSASVSNGNTPTISYASATATVTNDNGCITVNGSTVTITCAGDYYVNGNGSGQVQVNAASTDNVYLHLNNLTLSNSSDAPIYVRNADKALIVLEDGTTNTLSDGSSRSTFYTKDDGTQDTTGACIYAKDDLTIKGNGTLKVTGSYNNGIHTSNDLRVRGNPTINVTAKNNGLKGKGLVDIEGGYITIAATEGDGIKSDEGEDEGIITEGKGVVDIKGGTITITKSGDDGIQAYNYIYIRDSISTPTIKVTSTGKGIVSENRVYVNAGNIDISSGDDGVHSNLNIYFNGGYTTITASGNDGVHADSTLMINDGTIYVKNSYEGLEAWYIKVYGGTTDVYATDDAWNAAGGSDGSGSTTQDGQSNWGPGGGSMGGASGSSSGFLTVTGGVHHAKTASGDTDGIDSNGEMTISGGVMIVECQINGGQGGSFDSDGTATLSSKTLLGFSTGKSEKGTNYSVSFNTNNYYGNSYVAFKPTISGSKIVATATPSQISSVSGYSKNVTFPSGSTVYYNE